MTKQELLPIMAEQREEFLSEDFSHYKGQKNSIAMI